MLVKYYETHYSAAEGQITHFLLHGAEELVGEARDVIADYFHNLRDSILPPKVVI